MTPFPLKYFLSVTKVAGHYYPNFTTFGLGSLDNWPPDGIIKAADRKAFDEVYSYVEDMCANLELDASRVTVRKMRDCLKAPKTRYKDFFGFGVELYDRLRDQMGERQTFSLTLSETAQYLEPLKGWEEVVKRLPDAQRDIEEARKCQAFSRYAAAVFHSLQVTELGMIALGAELGVTDPLTGWTATRSKLTAILKAKYPDRTDFEKKHSAFLEQVQATIEVLNSAWRNKVSHAQGKFSLLTADFTPDVTEEILTATRSFMRRLVTEGPLAP